MKLLSIEYIPGAEIEALGMVKGTIVQTKNVGKDFACSLQNVAFYCISFFVYFR